MSKPEEMLEAATKMSDAELLKLAENDRRILEFVASVTPVRIRIEQLMECRRELDKGMLAAGSVDYAFQMDAKETLWWLCKAVLLLIEKELKK